MRSNSTASTRSYCDTFDLDDLYDDKHNNDGKSSNDKEQTCASAPRNVTGEIILIGNTSIDEKGEGFLKKRSKSDGDDDRWVTKKRTLADNSDLL